VYNYKRRIHITSLLRNSIANVSASYAVITRNLYDKLVSNILFRLIRYIVRAKQHMAIQLDPQITERHQQPTVIDTKQNRHGKKNSGCDWTSQWYSYNSDK